MDKQKAGANARHPKFSGMMRESERKYPAAIAKPRNPRRVNLAISTEQSPDGSGEWRKAFGSGSWV